MKARYRYRIYPNQIQKIALAKLFGCCITVWNDALAHGNDLCKQGQKKTGNGDLQKQFITKAKTTENREWLKEI